MNFGRAYIRVVFMLCIRKEGGGWSGGDSLLWTQSLLPSYRGERSVFTMSRT